MLEDGLEWMKMLREIDSIAVVSFGKHELETRRLVTKSRAQYAEKRRWLLDDLRRSSRS
jgi:hypothetical protein